MDLSVCRVVCWLSISALTGCSTVSDVGFAVATKDLSVVQRVIAPHVLQESSDLAVDGLNTITLNSADPTTDMNTDSFEELSDSTLCLWMGYEKADLVIANRKLECPDVFVTNHSEAVLTQLFQCLRSAELLKQIGGAVTIYEYELLSKPVPRSPPSAFIKYSKKADEFAQSVLNEGGKQAIETLVKQCIRQRQREALASG